MPAHSVLDFLRPGEQPRYSDFAAVDGNFDHLKLKGFAYIQRRSALREVWMLAECCWHKYRDALRLVDPAMPFPETLQHPFEPDLHWLLLAYDKLFIWYREHVFDRQLDLFECNLAREINRWTHFRESWCLGVILREPASIRSTLQAAGMLPSRDGQSSEYREFENLIDHWKKGVNSHVHQQPRTHADEGCGLRCRAAPPATQRRGDPYINHPLKVAGILAEAGETDVDLLVAAILHDTVKDTDTSLEEIAAHFAEPWPYWLTT